MQDLPSLQVEDAARRRVREDSEREGLPRLDPKSAAFVDVLARGVGAHRVLEVGCCLGYSALWFADAVGADGTVETIEADEDLARRARANFAAAGVASRVRVHVGRALDVLPDLEGPFDLAFLDADKREYTACLQHALRLVRPGGLVVADNALWGGKVADPAATDPDTEGIRAYLRAASSHPRLRTVVVPVGDGVAVSVVGADR